MENQICLGAGVGKFFYYLLLALLGAIIVHIVVLLLVPFYADNSMMARLEAQSETLGGDGQFIALDDDNPLMIRLDPAFRIRACPIDLTEGPVHLIAQGDVPFWSLSLYNQEGSNLYSVNKRTMADAALDLVVGTALQIIDYKRYQATQTQEQGNSVLTQHNIGKGFVVLRAYTPSPDWEPLVEAFLQSALCIKI